MPDGDRAALTDGSAPSRAPAREPARRDRTLTAALRTAGVVLLALGVVVLGFVPYALFATRGAAEQAQAVLGRALPELALPARTSSGGQAPHPAGTPASIAPRAVRWPKQIALGTALARLSVPAAGVHDDVVVQGTDELRLESGPGHYSASPLPGDPGNVAIAGHRTTWLRPFYNLQDVHPGDPITLQVAGLTYTYRVTRVFAVLPSDVAVLAPLRGWWLTLTTCNPPYSAAQRLVVRAHLTITQRRAAPSTGAHGRAGAASTRPPAAPLVRVAPAPAPLPAVPPTVLGLWLAGAAVLVAGGVRLARRRRLALLALLPACWCVFEAYGAAVRLIPGSW